MDIGVGSRYNLYMKISSEYLAVIVGVISFILQYFKINIGTEDITNVVTALAGAYSAVYLLVKRYKRGGVTVLGVRK